MPLPKTLEEIEVTIELKKQKFADNEFWAFKTSGGDTIPLVGTGVTVADAMIQVIKQIEKTERLKRGKDVSDMSNGGDIDHVIFEPEVDERSELEILQDYLATMIRHDEDPDSTTTQQEKNEIARVKAQIVELGGTVE